MKCLVGVLEAQQHVLQDRQSPLPHDGVQQLGEDLVEEIKEQMRRQKPAGEGNSRKQRHWASTMAAGLFLFYAGC